MSNIFDALNALIYDFIEFKVSYANENK